MFGRRVIGNIVIIFLIIDYEYVGVYSVLKVRFEIIVYDTRWLFEVSAIANGRVRLTPSLHSEYFLAYNEKLLLMVTKSLKWISLI